MLHLLLLVVLVSPLVDPQQQQQQGRVAVPLAGSVLAGHLFPVLQLLLNYHRDCSLWWMIAQRAKQQQQQVASLDLSAASLHQLVQQ
jgi:hypothetical protein